VKLKPAPHNAAPNEVPPCRDAVLNSIVASTFLGERHRRDLCEGRREFLSQQLYGKRISGGKSALGATQPSKSALAHWLAHRT
jgi:hypothetical protein